MFNIPIGKNAKVALATKTCQLADFPKLNSTSTCLFTLMVKFLKADIAFRHGRKVTHPVQILNKSDKREHFTKAVSRFLRQ